MDSSSRLICSSNFSIHAECCSVRHFYMSHTLSRTKPFPVIRPTWLYMAHGCTCCSIRSFLFFVFHTQWNFWSLNTKLIISEKWIHYWTNGTVSLVKKSVFFFLFLWIHMLTILPLNFSFSNCFFFLIFLNY